MGAAVPRVVLVSRRSDYELLLARHATRGQARFFLETRGQDIDVIEAEHHGFVAAREQALAAIPSPWRRGHVTRDDLDRFLFEPDDIIVAVGQDGLVANVAKYLVGQPVIGVNPLPDRFDGVLVRHSPGDVAGLLARMDGERTIELEHRTMVEVRLDDGQTLRALNEIFIGQRTHQSARYRISWGDRDERHSSSGVIVSTGTGATGWARSINLSRGNLVEMPGPTDPRLAFFVREAFPSIATGTEVTSGQVTRRRVLSLVSEMNDGGVIFGDGLEGDFLGFDWGRRAEVRAAETSLALVA